MNCKTIDKLDIRGQLVLGQELLIPTFTGYSKAVITRITPHVEAESEAFLFLLEEYEELWYNACYMDKKAIKLADFA